MFILFACCFFILKMLKKIQVESEKLGRGFKRVSFTDEIVQNRNPVFNTYL